MSEIVGIPALLFLFLALFRLRLAFFVFVFLLPFAPRYLGVIVGSGLALSLKRLMVYSLLIAIVLSISWRPLQWRYTLSFFYRWRRFFLLLLFIYMIKAVSTLTGGEAQNIVYWLDEFCSIFVIMLLAIRFVDDSRAFHRILVVGMVGVLGSEILAITEYALQHPLLQGLDVEITQAWDISTGIFRGDQYRVMAGFDNPLLLSQFLCFMTPFIICAYTLRVERSLAIVCGLLILPVIYLTDSRGGILIFFIAIFLISALRLQRSLVVRQKILISLLIRLVIVGGVAMLIAAILYPDWFLNSIASDETYVRSTAARLWQYTQVLGAVSDRMILGYGMMQNFSAVGNIEGLDNYYLRLLLEGGGTVLVIYLTFAYMQIRIATKKIRSLPAGSPQSVAMITLLVSSVTYMLSGLFISMPTNNLYWYLSISLILIISSKGDDIIKPKLATASGAGNKAWHID